MLRDFRRIQRRSHGDAVRAINNLATAQVRNDTPTKELGHWQRRGFSTVVEEDGGIFRWSDQGVRDGVGVGS